MPPAQPPVRAGVQLRHTVQAQGPTARRKGSASCQPRTGKGQRGLSCGLYPMICLPGPNSGVGRWVIDVSLLSPERGMFIGLITAHAMSNGPGWEPGRLYREALHLMREGRSQLA